MKEAVRQIIDILKNTTSIAMESSRKLEALEMALKKHPQLEQDYRTSLVQLISNSAEIAASIEFEVLEKYLREKE